MAAALAAFSIVAMAACSSDDDTSADAEFSESAITQSGADEAESPAEFAESDGASAADAAPAAEFDTTAGSTGLDLGTIGRDVIVEMRVSMTTTDLRATVQGISRSARLHEGGIAASNVDYGTADADGEPPTGYATIVVKVPPERLDTVIADLSGLGTVTSVGTDSQDVTDELRDLDMEIKNAAASVEQVRALLAQATDVRTIVEIEAELTARQTRLDQLTAVQADLEDRVALATLTIDVRAVSPTDAAAATTPDGDGIGDAFATGWDAFVGVLFTIGFVAAVIAPFVAVAALLAGVALLVARAARTGRRRAVDSDVDSDAVAGVTASEELVPSSHQE